MRKLEVAVHENDVALHSQRNLMEIGLSGVNRSLNLLPSNEQVEEMVSKLQEKLEDDMQNQKKQMETEMSTVKRSLGLLPSNEQVKDMVSKLQGRLEQDIQTQKKRTETEISRVNGSLNLLPSNEQVKDMVSKLQEKLEKGIDAEITKLNLQQKLKSTERLLQELLPLQTCHAPCSVLASPRDEKHRKTNIWCFNSIIAIN